MFEDYIRDHVDKWFNWAQKTGLGVERMEDLILVTGRTLVTSWAAAVFVDNAFDAEISLASRKLDTAGRFFFGPTFGDAYFVTIVVSSQSVPHATSSRHALMFS